MKKAILLFAAICLCVLAACSAEKATEAPETEQPAPSETQTVGGGNTEAAVPVAEDDTQSQEAAAPAEEDEAQVSEAVLPAEESEEEQEHAAPVEEETTEAPETAEPAAAVEADGTYDITQPMQESELVLPNGVQLGMRYEEVEAICGTLQEEEFENIYQDSEHIRYFFWAGDDASLKLGMVNFMSEVVNDELVYTTLPEAAAFRDMHLGDTIDEVFDKLPCVDRELKRWATQYVYGSENTGDRAVLSLIADSFYTLSIYVDGVQRAHISFSRVQQRVFDIQIYGEDYWGE